MTSKGIMPQIEHFVVLMMENRSLDALCGWLYAGGADLPRRVIGKDVGRAYDGLEEGQFSNPLDGREHPVIKTSPRADRLPPFNPHEDYKHVNVQLFRRAVPPPRPTAAGMRGFLEDYSASYTRPEEILSCYTPAALPAINTLAKSYAISDRFFCSVPTQTNPNRAFFACGTSLGRESNLGSHAHEQFDANTIWNVLAANQAEWKIYFHDAWGGKQCYTQYTFPRIEQAPNPGRRERFAHFSRFRADVRQGDLPAFTFIEPSWSYGFGGIYKQGNDYHPPARVGPADDLISDVYNVLRANRAVWSKTLLVITFDEHGGTFDHVPPPWGAINPDGRRGESGFEFDRYGVRVPTLLVSPYVPERTVFRASGDAEYDLTSITATILKWRGIDPAASGLGKRVAAAPTFEEVLVGTRRAEDEAIVVPPRVEAADASAPAVEADLAFGEEARSPMGARGLTLAQELAEMPPAVGKELSDLATSEADLARRIASYNATGAIEP